jgi:hypothetical protein
VKRSLAILAALGVVLVLTGCPSTRRATNVTGTAATLNGGAGDALSGGGSYWFQYGRTRSYGAETQHRKVGTNLRGQNLSARVAGLAPATTYHFRLAAQRSGRAPVYAPDQTFTTLPASQPDFPVRGTFYYPWFPETWGSCERPHTRFHPTLGCYDSTERALIRRHLAALEYGKFDVAISSWWGPGHRTDERLSPLLEQTWSARAATDLRWAVYYEPRTSDVAKLRSDLAYLRSRYARHPAYYRVGGRFVVFVWNGGSQSCASAARWRRANAVGAYIVLKVFPGWRNCPFQPHGWHQYGDPRGQHDQESFNIGPGFWSWREAAPRPGRARDLASFRQNVRDMVASRAKFQLVVSFNEWGEGTAVEGAREWASPSGYGRYLDALHNDGASPP